MTIRSCVMIIRECSWNESLDGGVVSESSYDIIGLLISVMGSAASVVSAIVGIVQLIKPSSDDMDVVTVQCLMFQRVIIPKYQEVERFYRQKKLDVLRRVKIDKEKGVIQKPSRIKKGTDEYLIAVMNLFNEMDMFAMKINDLNSPKKLAMAYKIQGRAFCEIIESLRPIYELFMLTNEQDYVNLSHLYDEWKVRV